MREELPPPLPPATRTVGQLVAETVRFYQDHFWRVLPLGLPIAAIDQIPRHAFVLFAAAPLLTAAYIAASALVGAVAPTRRSLTVALVSGVVVFVPAAALSGWFALLAVAWLAFAGFVVPVAVIERTRLRETFVRARRLARADFVHAVGGLAALAIVYLLVRQVLVVLLKTQGDAAERIAVFLADLVLSPIVFVGAALLYFDQAARVVDSAHAAVHHAVDAVDAGRPDAQGES